MMTAMAMPEQYSVTSLLRVMGPEVLATMGQSQQLWAEVQYWTPVAMILGMFFCIFVLILVMNIASGITGESYIDRLFSYNTIDS